MTLPKQIREEMEKAFQDLWQNKYAKFWPTLKSNDLCVKMFEHGASYLYAHLTGLAEKGFDEEAVEADALEYERRECVDKDDVWCGASLNVGYCEGRKVQYAQTQALIVARDAEIKRLETMYLELRDGHEHVVHKMHDEIADLKRQLADYENSIYCTCPGYSLTRGMGMGRLCNDCGKKI